MRSVGFLAAFCSNQLQGWESPNKRCSRFTCSFPGGSNYTYWDFSVMRPCLCPSHPRRCPKAHGKTRCSGCGLCSFPRPLTVGCGDLTSLPQSLKGYIQHNNLAAFTKPQTYFGFPTLFLELITVGGFEATIASIGLTNMQDTYKWLLIEHSPCAY